MRWAICLLVWWLLTIGQSRPAPAVVIYSNEFESAVGAEWSFNTTSTAPAGTGFLGEFGNDVVVLSLPGLSTAPASITFDLYVIRSWDGNDGDSGDPQSSYGPDVFTVLANRIEALKASFGNWVGGTQSYPDAFPGGANPHFTGASEVGTLGFGQDSVYRLSFDVAPTEGLLQITFEADLAEGPTLPDIRENESWGIDNVVITVQGIPGDTNDDGSVDVADLNNVRNNFSLGELGGPPIPGEAFPFDGIVNLNDLNLVRNNFGNTAETAAVPEPSAITLFVLMLSAVYVKKRHR